jgi:Fe-S-cluster formation regulator IscX/YfhJ
VIFLPTELNNLDLAVLIDADNAPRTALGSIMQEIAIYGTPTIKRIYGDWTNPNIGSWKLSLLENAITPVQQYGYTTGKNSTDSAMIIDAMDILYAGHVDGFVIVSSDSDFTRLAIRLREAGHRVIGIGEKKTPAPFIASCDKFIYIDLIRTKYQENEDDKLGQRQRRSQKKTNEHPPVPSDIVKLIADSVSDIADEEGWAYLGELGNLLIKKRPDFDSRNFGFSKLTPLINSLPRFDVDARKVAGTNTTHMYVRDKEV